MRQGTGFFPHRHLPEMGVTVVGLGPGGIEYVDTATLEAIEGADTVVLRTLEHPAASVLAGERDVVTCDDLYDELAEFDDVYTAIADRVMAATESGSVVYAVPGSAVVGEQAVAKIRERAASAAIEFSLLRALSFLDLVFLALDLDPIADGLQILDARDLSDPLPLHLPTIITQVDSQHRAGDVSLSLTRTIDPDTEITLLDRLGDKDEVVLVLTAGELARYPAGPRTTVYVPATLSGILGLIETNRVLRRECPWDRDQTHHSLLTHLIEEAYETADVIGQLPESAPGGEPDFGVYAEVEEELGDLLLQVIFHATLAAEAGAFDFDEVAEAIRRKLVQRHPHVFGEIDVADADEVLANWEQIKKVEKQRDSLMDDIPTGMPAIARAMKVQKRARSVGFDWDDPAGVLAALNEEIAELVAAISKNEAVSGELGDVLFTAINLARHLGVDPEVALRSTGDKFISRFREMEEQFALQSTEIAGATAAELEEAWSAAKLVVG